jgi:hypothetical protein
MSELSKKSVISEENFEELKNMMLSNDDASVNLALTILEQSDYAQSEIYIMCMLKDTFSKAFDSVSSFKDKTPILAQNITDSLDIEDVDITRLSSKHVYERAVKRDVQKELEFVLGLLKVDLVNLLDNMGYDFVNFTEVLIKPKGWEQSNKEKLNQLELVNE